MSGRGFWEQWLRSQATAPPNMLHFPWFCVLLRPAAVAARSHLRDLGEQGGSNHLGPFWILSE